MRIAVLHGDFDNLGRIGSEAAEGGDAAMTTGREWLVPSRLFGDELQHAAQAIGAPLGVEVGDLLVLGQQVQAVLQRVLAGRDGEFVDKTLAGEGHLRGVDRAQPSQRNGARRRDDIRWLMLGMR